MNQDQIKKYQSFDFNGNAQWNEYLKNIFPTPTGALLEKKKKQWYKNNIDPDFDVNFGTSEPPKEEKPEPKSEPKQEETKSNPQPNQSYSSQPAQSGLSENIKQAIYKVEGYLKLGFLIFTIFPILSGSFLVINGVIINILALIRQAGMLPFSIAFFRKISKNDFFFNLLYIINVCIVGGYSTTVFFFPIAIHFLLGTAIFVTQKPGTFGFILRNQQFNNLIQIAKLSKDMLMETKCIVELGIGVYLLILFALGKGPLVGFITYLPFLFYKYTNSPTMMMTVSNLKRKVMP
jgi:hypothetical protein